MKLPLNCLMVVLLLTQYAGMAQTSGNLSGIVQDTAGHPLAGLPLTLTNDRAEAPAHVTTDGKGEFHFDNLGFQSYHLATDKPGATLITPGPIVLTLDNHEIRLSLFVRQTAAGSSSASAATLPSSDKTAAPSLNLQAAGIRGYIDPGGYSAPAGAAAATDIVRGITDVKRDDNDTSQTIEVSCSMQTELLKAVSDHPGDATANFHLGQVYLAHDQAALALVYLQRAWKLDSDNPEILPALAEALLQDRQFQAANQLLQTNTGRLKTAELHRMLARSYEGIGKFTQASEEYQSAALLKPNPDNFFGVGYELLLAGSPEAASQAFQSAEEQFPNSTILLMGIGTAAFLQGHSAEATHSFLRAASLNPSDPRPYSLLAASSRISHVEEDAVRESFRHFYEISPNNAQAVYFYAESLSHGSSGVNDADSDQRQALLQKAIRLNPQFVKAHVQLASIYFERMEYADAINELETALRLDPTLFEAHYRLSAAQRRLGHIKQADREMQLFFQVKSTKSSTGPTSDIDLESFVSVFNRHINETSQHTKCAGD